MRLNHVVGIIIVAMFGLGMQLTAQPDTQKPKEHTMTGCLKLDTEDNSYKLEKIEGNGPKEAELRKVPASLNIEKHVGHKVAITGTGASGPKKEHLMMPTALKMIAASCT